MAYADQQMSGNRVVAIIIVALIHIAVGYALVTGLAYSTIKKVMERVTTVDVEEPPPSEEPPPPPPPSNVPPPPVAPPPPINIAIAPPPIRVQQDIPPIQQPVIRIVPTAAPPPPPPPKPVQPNPSPRGNTSSWASTDDYPARALRQEEQGTTRFRVTVGPNGRVQDCQVTASSGHEDLDQTTCRLITSRGRFDPAKDADGNPMVGYWSSQVKWVIPDE